MQTHRSFMLPMLLVAATLLAQALHAATDAASTFKLVDVKDDALSQQIIIMASKPITCTTTVLQDKHQFVLDLAGLSLNSGDQSAIRRKVSPLLAKGLINQLDVEATDNGTRFVLTFAPQRMVHTSREDAAKEEKNCVLLLSCSYPQKVSIDIYAQEALDKILTRDSFMRFAKQDRPAEGLMPVRIVIDPGHGGDDEGAKSAGGLREKDVSLAISKRVCNLLSKDFPTYMTRYEDVEMSLSQRALCASQLQASLFVSIHANGAANPHAHGIETYYFPAKELRDRKHFDFLFVNQPRDLALVKKIQHHIGLMAQDSYQLAQTIQHTVCNGLAEKYDGIHNRGAKAETFRLFLQNQNVQIPSVLVETGFITNKHDAKLLSNSEYCNDFASLVAQAIKSFIQVGATQAAVA